MTAIMDQLSACDGLSPCKNISVDTIAILQCVSRIHVHTYVHKCTQSLNFEC